MMELINANQGTVVSVGAVVILFILGKLYLVLKEYVAKTETKIDDELLAKIEEEVKTKAKQ